MSSEVLLRVDGLTLASKEREIVGSVSFQVAPGQAIGLVGESGSGKSLTLRGIMGLLPRGVFHSAGSVEIDGRAAMVFQDPLTALDPLAAVGKQVAEVVRNTRRCSRAEAKARSLELLRDVGLPEPEQQWGRLPGQLSGGQRQRAVIAVALATEPTVLLCDEPTTALDVTIQAEVLRLLDSLRTDLGLALVFVSHDLAVVANMCSDLLVMKDGAFVETGPTAVVLTQPQNDYTAMLIGSVLALPALRAQTVGER
jgi:ABC-type glutathione transport system ATPase component